MRQIVPHKNAARILIIVPGGLNYYFDAVGQRLASAFRTLGCSVECCTLQTYQPAEYQLTLYVNIYEIGVSYCRNYHDFSGLMPIVAAINERTTQVGVVSLECVETPWFANILRVSKQAGISTIYDIGFHDQSSGLAHEERIEYHFILNGLTHNERLKAQQHLQEQTERPVPWVFIGHKQSRRIEFAQYLVERLGANGILYLPDLTQVSPDGPHFNNQQLHKVLRGARYYIWTSHHEYFYVESERFRDALLAGCVPIKVWRASTGTMRSEVPFSYLILDQNDFDAHLFTIDYSRLRQRFIKDFLALPSLEESVAQILKAHAFI